MASIILKKRKLCEAIEENLQITPSTFEVKKRIDENGEYKSLYESILPNLKALFPDHDDKYLMETLKANKNDIIGAIECLKYRKPQSPVRVAPSIATNLDGNIVTAINHLSQCASQEQAYVLLTEFKKQALTEVNDTKLRTEAENTLLRKAFKIQRDIMARELYKRHVSEKISESKSEEVDKLKVMVVTLARKLEQMEKSQTQSLFNNQIY